MRIQLACVSNVYSRIMHFDKAGEIERGHTHPFDHVTLLASGSLKITVNGVVSLFRAPCAIFIAKDTIHELEATSDNTVAACIHALRDGRHGDIIDPESIPKGLNALLMPGVAQSIVGVT